MITTITKEQWKSIVRNSIFAGLTTFVLVLQSSASLDKKAVFAAATAAGMSIFKIVEKAFTE
jgi:hypothetical protein